MGFLYLMLLFLGFAQSANQTLNANELLERSIQYHDPSDAWKSFKGTLFVTMKTSGKSDRISRIDINLPLEFFALSSKRDTTELYYKVDKGVCSLALNRSERFTQAQANAHRLTCERAVTMKDYYTYLYGLPMKLKDPGTLLDPVVQTKTFMGKEYLVLKVSYEAEVGDDTWYFYFDPHTYAMEVYQFFHDETKNDGEYILLSELEVVSGIKMPKKRAWYYNKNNQHLGTDLLSSSQDRP